MPTIIQTESTLTDRYQTTVPEVIRRALGLQKRDQIQYRVSPKGVVELARKKRQEEKEPDPVVSEFLNFLAQDITRHPRGVRSMDGAYIKKIRKLTEGASRDLNRPLSPDDE